MTRRHDYSEPYKAKVDVIMSMKLKHLKEAMAKFKDILNIDGMVNRFFDLIKRKVTLV